MRRSWIDATSGARIKSNIIHHNGSLLLLHPIRQNRYGLIGLHGIVREQMHAEVVLATHIAVHHKLDVHRCLLTGIKDHRTDGRCGRSTPLDNFDVWRLSEAQWLFTDVCHFKLGLDGLT